MSIIGLFDGDMANFQTTMFNLELMKISSYFKNNRNIVTLSRHIDPEKYSKFFYYKDYDTGLYNKKISNYLGKPNFFYGGLAFSNNKYISLPEDIEKAIPDFSIYLKYRSLFNISKAAARDFNTMIISPHFRLSIDGTNIFEDSLKFLYAKNPITYICHDFNLCNIKNAREYLQKILNQDNKRKGFLATKFPATLVDSQDELLEWQKLRWSSNMSSFKYYGLIDDEVFCDLVKIKKDYCKNQKFEYIVTYNCKDDNDFLINRLSKIFKQATFLQMNKLKIFLKYEDNFFEDKRYERLIDLFNFYISTAFSPTIQDNFQNFINNSSLSSFCAHLLDWTHLIALLNIDIQEARELFLWIKEIDYSLFKDFYECKKVKLSNGVFVND